MDFNIQSLLNSRKEIDIEKVIEDDFIQKILEDVEIHLKGYPAGGFIRDLLFKGSGSKSKDLDYIVPVPSESLQEEVKNIVEFVLKPQLQAKGFNVEFYKMYLLGEECDVLHETDFDKNIIGCLKVGTKLDILFYKAKNIEEVLGKFDANINRYYIEDGEIKTTNPDLEKPEKIIVDGELGDGRLNRLEVLSQELNIPLEVCNGCK